MCLSTLYRIKDDSSEREKVAEYISNMISRDGEYIFTDVMGEEYSVRGCIRSLDLVKNEITIKVDKETA